MSSKIFRKLIVIFLLALSTQSLAVDFRTEQLARLPGTPWGMDFLNNTQLIVTLRSGSVFLVDLQHKRSTEINGLAEIAVNGQGGLLDVAVSPENHWIYFTYSKSTADGDVTTLARARLKGNQLVDWKDLLVTDSATDTGRHFGSRIAFDGKGHLFFGIGDRGVRETAQNLSNHAGSIIRLKLDGSVPTDNPFVNQGNKRAEIWSYGHRNPQGLVFDKNADRLWEIEHGPRGGDEINLVKKGENYGWPVVSHGKEYWGPISVGEGTEKPGMESPLKVYIPSIAPGGLMFYSGEAFPEWKNSLFAGALKLQHINRVPVLSDGTLGAEERLLEDLGERIRAIKQGPQGYIYFSTDSGRIMRLRPAS